MDLQKLVENPTIQRLWRVSKLYHLPIYDERITSLTNYELDLIDMLVINDHKDLIKEPQGFVDPEFEEQWEEIVG